MLDLGHNNNPKQAVFYNYKINELKQQQQQIAVSKVFLLVCVSMYKILVCEQKKLVSSEPKEWSFFLAQVSNSFHSVEFL